MPVTEVIEGFLRANPIGKLDVAVGYASAYGLGWLDQRTRGRPVWLLIGDIRTGFSNHSEVDRLAALAFLDRSDVEVVNWYRTDKNQLGKAEAHLKVWMVRPDSSRGIKSAVMVGSANLTKAGLHDNFEVMAEVVEGDHPRLFSQMSELQKDAWSADSLRGRLDQADRKPRDDPPRAHRAKPKRARPRHPSRSKSRSGCAQAVVKFSVLVVIAAAAIIAFGIGRASTVSSSLRRVSPPIVPPAR